MKIFRCCAYYRVFIFQILTFFVVQIASANAGCPPGKNTSDVSPPTDIKRTYIRKGPGEFNANRKGNKKHAGVDILTRATYNDKSAYAVYAIANGTVAYAQFNGKGLDNGFGNVIVVDHQNGCYSMVAHLASDPFTPLNNPSDNLLVKIGQKIKKGQLIGYFVDLTKGVYSSGNAQRTAVGARWQTHFQMFEASPGRKGPGSIKKTFLSNGGKIKDPTSLLISLGLKIQGLP